MRIFRCDFCGNALYFENEACLRCGSALAFLPGRMDLCAIEPAEVDAPGLWRRKVPHPGLPLRRWRMCRNRAQANTCNFALPEHDPGPLCVSCRQTRVLPDLSVPGNAQRWYRIEVAKRRLFFSLARLGLADPEPPPGQDQGPAYEFLASLPGQPVSTGHRQGVITLDVAEADDAERLRRRQSLGEPYRTLLGHLRHESGHYYWDQLVAGSPWLEDFRARFGDERADYAQALQVHYQRAGPPAGWQEGFVSAYATAHPWEDWAETWAHYLHMADLLETAASFDTRVRVPGTEPAGEGLDDPFAAGPGDFDALVAAWVPLTLLLNSLNRSLGQEDAYPFALGPGALDKLRWVHDRVHAPQGRA